MQCVWLLAPKVTSFVVLQNGLDRTPRLETTSRMMACMMDSTPVPIEFLFLSRPNRSGCPAAIMLLCSWKTKSTPGLLVCCTCCSATNNCGTTQFDRCLLLGRPLLELDPGTYERLLGFGWSKTMLSSVMMMWFAIRGVVEE